MFRKLLSRDPMPTNLLGAVAPGVEYATETEEEEKKTLVCTKTALHYPVESYSSSSTF